MLRRSDPLFVLSLLVVKGTPTLSESVDLRGEAPEGESSLACCSRRRNSNGGAWSQARDQRVSGACQGGEPLSAIAMRWQPVWRQTHPR